MFTPTHTITYDANDADPYVVMCIPADQFDDGLGGPDNLVCYTRDEYEYGLPADFEFIGGMLLFQGAPELGATLVEWV